MTNIRPYQTMEALQEIAHPHKHSIVLKNTCGDKEYWQKVWMIDRFVRALGFVKEDSL